MLAGRGRELTELKAALGDAAAGRGRAVVVLGEPGIGKSALVEQVAVHAEEQSFAVHWARCVEIGGAPAYWPWRQLLRTVATRPSSSEADLSIEAALSTLVADPSAQRSQRHGAAESEEHRFLVSEGLARLLDAAAAERPQLLVIEDVHAADIPSLHLARFIAAHGQGRGRWLLVLTSRTEAPPERAQPLADLRAATTVLELRGLDQEEVGVLVGSRGRTEDDGVVAALHDATGGNPLFVNALLSHLASQGLLDDLRGGRPVGLPNTIRAVLKTPLDRLSPPIRRHLATLAVLGREVDVGTARRVVGDELESVLDAGLAEGVLERAAGGIRFIHALARGALLELLGTTELHETHRAVAVALEEEEGKPGPERLAALAYHYGEAGPECRAKTFAYGRAAGDDSRRVGAFESAADQYRRALEAGAPDTRSQAETMVALGEALIRSGRVDAGRAICADAWDAARGVNAVDVMGEAALAYARLGDGGVLNEEVVRLVTGALAEIGPDASGLRARLRARLASEILNAGADETREVLAREAAQEALETGDPLVILSALRYAQSAAAMPDNVYTCLSWTSAAAAAADAVGDLAAKAEVVAYRSIHHFTLGDVAAYGTDTAMVAQLASRFPTPLNEWHVTVAAGCRAMLDGRFEDTASHIEASLAFAGSVPNAIVSWQFQDFSLGWEKADLARFEPILQALVELRPGAALMARAALALVQAETGRPAEATDALSELTRELAGRRLPWLWLLTAGWLAEASVLVEDEGSARALSELLAPFADLHVVGATGTVAAYWGSVRRHLGNLALVLGRSDLAVEHHEAALSSHVAIGSAPFTARSRLELACALLARGDPGDQPRAEALVAEADTAAKRLGMLQLLGRIERIAEERPAGSGLPGPGFTRPSLVKEGDFWTMSSGDRVVRLRDTKGLAYLAVLLQQPSREVHVLDLAGAAPDQTGVGRLGEDDVLDARARNEYRRRLQDLEEEMAHADAAGDLGRSERVHAEWDFLVEELKRATGVGGRSRSLGTPPAETARVAVTKAIRSVLKKIEGADADLGRHFRATIRTGTFCSYSSDLEPCLEWEVRPD